MYIKAFFVGVFSLTFSVNVFANKSKFDDPDLEDTVFVCEEQLIPHVTRQALEMPAKLQDEMSRAHRRQVAREEKQIREAMEDAFDLALETNFASPRKLDDEFEEIGDEQIESSVPEEVHVNFLDPVWFEENIKKPYAKLKAREAGQGDLDTGDLKETDFWKTPTGIKLKKFGLVF